MIINIISIGKLSPGYRGLADHYYKMIKWKVKETELNYNKKLSENQAKTYEAKLINNHININSYKIVLDVQGQQLNSQEFSLLFKKPDDDRTKYRYYSRRGFWSRRFNY